MSSFSLPPIPTFIQKVLIGAFILCILTILLLVVYMEGDITTTTTDTEQPVATDDKQISEIQTNVFKLKQQNIKPVDSLQVEQQPDGSQIFRSDTPIDPDNVFITTVE